MAGIEKKEARNVVVGVRVTEKMGEAVAELLAMDAYVTVSDYIRDVLRRDLKQRGFFGRTPTGVDQ
jgi:Arc/MetJ-type ribon-helix-helix transcriptional regulator